MHIFDYSFLESGMIPVSLLNITADISALRVMAANRKDQFDDVFIQFRFLNRSLHGGLYRFLRC